jgi:hypothetical protein
VGSIGGRRGVFGVRVSEWMLVIQFSGTDRGSSIRVIGHGVGGLVGGSEKGTEFVGK